jgi:transcription-repair coupling factor (superfamily II helicase)
MSLKEDIVRCFFINRPDSPYFESELFNRILGFVQTETNKARLKQTGKLFLLVIQPVKTMESLHQFLQALHNYCFTPIAAES